MKKIQIFGLALLGVFAFSAIAVASAFAEEPVWLIKGSAVTELTSVQVTGLLFLSDLKAPIVGVLTVNCEGILDGSVGSKGEDEITEVLNSAGEKIAANLGTPALNCTGTKGCEGLAEVWFDNLPWLTQLELMSNGTILDHLFGTGVEGGEPGYEVKCKDFGITSEDLCEGLSSALIQNMPEEKDVLGIFSEGVESEKMSCTLGGLGAGDLEGEGLIFTLSGEELAVSEV